MPHRTRLAILNTHPIQYFVPFYRAIVDERDIDLTVLYCSDFSLRGETDVDFGQEVVWDIDLLAGYRSEFLGSRAGNRKPVRFFSLICPEVIPRIRRAQYDAIIIHGYGFAVNFLAALTAKMVGTRIFIRSDSRYITGPRNWRSGLRDILVRRLYRLPDGFLAAGESNAKYYAALGIPEEKIHLMPFAVDNQRFMDESNLSPVERARFLRQAGLNPNLPVIAFAAKFVPSKHPLELIDAYFALRERGINASLLMAGSGLLLDECREAVDRSRFSADVALVGFVNQTDMPRVLGSCDVFVLPSDSDAWGLVVNEAMCAGLPVVTTTEVGCVPDLVIPNETGFVLAPGDNEALVSSLTQLLRDDVMRERMGRKALTVVGAWDFQRGIAGLREALEVG